MYTDSINKHCRTCKHWRTLERPIEGRRGESLMYFRKYIFHYHLELFLFVSENRPFSLKIALLLLTNTWPSSCTYEYAQIHQAIWIELSAYTFYLMVNVKIFRISQRFPTPDAIVLSYRLFSEAVVSSRCSWVRGCPRSVHQRIRSCSIICASISNCIFAREYLPKISISLAPREKHWKSGVIG